MPQQRRGLLRSKGLGLGKLYSKRVEKRFIQKEGGSASFLEPPAMPRTGVTIALSWNRIHYASPCQDEGAPRRSLFFVTFRSSFSPLRASCCNCRRRGLVVASFFAVFLHHRAQMPVILHPPVPFMDIAVPLLYRTSMLRVCVNYYTRAMYIRAAYIRITSARPARRPYYYLDV